ncbi:MAG TPA: glutamate formimidoyltransferase [Methanomassiliicoccales archaeon]|nr:glutamate formimidoyltransferase [Methanomassiliicoccales archaeon]
MALVECVPNFSEGRRKEVIEAVVEAMRQASGAMILDIRSDPDHNRTVVTMVGSPADCSVAAFAGTKVAAERIDMTQHKGEHPRIGAMDVIPFVPISDITLDECVPVAKALAERISKQLGIPTYLYEEAATTPERRDLAHIRIGQYEGLKESIKFDPSRRPDFGPSELGNAGATVVGAREFLVAYNAYLNTSDVAKAKAIAKKIREKDGGLRHVKAMGFETKPQVQVSINLTNFREMPMHQVLEAVRKEASKEGLKVTETEVFGMLPADALYAAAEHYLQLGKGWQRDQIIERKLMGVEKKVTELRSAPIDEFLKELASGTPTPGGGSAASVLGAMGAALGAMVCRLTLGKKGYEEVQPMMHEAASHFDSMRDRLEALIDADARSYEQVMNAFRLPKGTEAEKRARTDAIQHATKAAAEVPLQTATLCCEVVDELIAISKKGNKNAITDAAVGLQCAFAGLISACVNVEVNLITIKDEKFVARTRERLLHLQSGSRERVDEAVDAIRKGMSA